ncbi:MAG: hypothetical protein CME06_01645 [Gemmatimonadetes bacterium]|nr:hypothetical protein [Gemmatimonadota bacterium]
MRSLIAFSVALAMASAADAGMGVGAKIGTPGFGLEATKSIVPMVNARLGFNMFGFGYETSQDGVDYDYDLSLRSVHLLADYHPIPLMGFRLSGGALLNKNKLEMVSQPTSASFEIGGETYTADQVGTIDGEVSFSSFAPYLGIGWGNAAGSRIGISTDLGVVFQGAPEVDLSANGLLGSDSGFQSELAEEANAIEDELGFFKYYPVFSIGISIKLTIL